MCEPVLKMAMTVGLVDDPVMWTMVILTTGPLYAETAAITIFTVAQTSISSIYDEAYSIHSWFVSVWSSGKKPAVKIVLTNRSVYGPGW